MIKSPANNQFAIENREGVDIAADVTGALVPQSGAHDLCMTFTQNGPDPFWVLDRLTLQ